MFKKDKRKFSIAFLLMLLITTVSTAIALTIVALNPTKLSAFSGQVINSDFTINGLEVDLLGKNKVRIKLDVTNTDSVMHFAEVTVQLLDSSGNILTIGGEEMKQTKDTGDINGGDIVTLTFTFTATDLVSYYDNHFIQIDQKG